MSVVLLTNGYFAMRTLGQKFEVTHSHTNFKSLLYFKPKSECSNENPCALPSPTIAS